MLRKYLLNAFRSISGRTRRDKAVDPALSSAQRSAPYQKCFGPEEEEQFAEGFTRRVFYVEETGGKARLWFQRNYSVPYDPTGNLVILAFISIKPSTGADSFDLERRLAEDGFEFRREGEFYRIRLPARARPGRVFQLACRYFNWTSDSELTKRYSDTPPER